MTRGVKPEPPESAPAVQVPVSQEAGAFFADAGRVHGHVMLEYGVHPQDLTQTNKYGSSAEFVGEEERFSRQDAKNAKGGGKDD
jgi:hypothetical protein